MPRPTLSALRRRNEVVATYAAVLDGVHLWLDVEAAGAVGVRDVDSGAVVRLGDHPHDLDGLTGLPGTTFEVLAGKAAVTVASLPHRPTARTPLAPDGVTRWETVLGEHGRLRLVRHTLPATAELEAADVRGDRLHLRVRPPDGVEAGSHLFLLDTDDQVLESLPATAHDGVLETLVAVDDLPAGYFGVLRLAVGTETGWVRIRRRADDLADPNHAVLLPELFAVDTDGETVTDQPRARLRWNPDGLLALRSLDPDEDGRRDGGASA